VLQFCSWQFPETFFTKPESMCGCYTNNKGVVQLTSVLVLPFFTDFSHSFWVLFFNTFRLWSTVTARIHVPQPYKEKGRLFYCVSFTQQRRKGVNFLPRNLMCFRCGLFMRKELKPASHLRCMKLKNLHDRTSLQRFVLIFIACQDELRCETCSLTLREERKLRVFENRMMRKISGLEGRRTRF